MNGINHAGVHMMSMHCKTIWVILTLEMVTSVAPCVRFLAMLLKCEGHSALHQS